LKRHEIGEYLVEMMKKKESSQINNVRNAKKDITTDPTEISGF